MLKQTLLLWLVVCYGNLWCGIWYGRNTANLAIIKDYVVDVTILPKKSSHYPASLSNPQDGTCLRAHQGLFNDVVQCIQETSGLVQIVFDDLYYGIDECGNKLATFWIAKHHLLFFRDAEERGIDITLFPSPLCTNTHENNSHTLVLTFPWQSYSLGTRFVRAEEYDTDEAYGVRFFDGIKIRFERILRDIVRVEGYVANIQARHMFVAFAQHLVTEVEKLGDDQVIPYVWGGSSFVSTYRDKMFYQTVTGVWERPEKYPVYTGYDCSELVFRLARISGLKLVWKTTLMLGKYLPALASGQALEDGDLIWMPGHVMIIASVTRNEIIEARGYASGYGKVVRSNIGSVFKGIASYEQLRRVYEDKKSVVLLDRKGADYKISEFKILKLC